MLLQNTIGEHLLEVDKAAREREEVILKQLEEKEPLPDKEKDQMAWVRAANQHRAIAEEIILSNEQVNYLMGGTAGINRLSCLYQLIQMVTRQIETSNEVGESTTELWEVNMSEVALSKLWKCDRKTVSKMLDHMNKLGILSSIQTRRGSVHTLLCISAWIVDGKKFVNPYYIPINQRSNYDKSSSSASTTAFPNKEDPPIKNGGTSPTQLANSSFSSLTSGNGDNGEKEDDPQPSVSDMELEAEARRQFFKEQMEAEDAPQFLLLG